MKAGMVVYRVVEVDPPGEEQHTWKVEAREVLRASTRQVKLKQPFSGVFASLFKPDALGRLFHETPLQAIHDFLTRQKLEIVSLERKRKEAERAIAWGLEQKVI